jgi:subfamily B ATP-binding cassette protein MsbA
MVAFGATDGGVPYLIKYILDGVFARQDKELLYLLPIALVFFAVIRAALDFGQQFLSRKIGHLIVRDMRNEMSSHLLTLEPGFFIKNSSADIVARTTNDVLLVRTLLTESVAAVLRDTIRIIALLVAAIALDPRLAAIAFLAFPIGIYPVYKFGRKLRKLSKRGQDAIGTLSGILQESILGNKVVKIFCRERYERERFERENDALSRTFITSERVQAITGPINEVLAAFGVSAVILYGGWSVIGGQRTQGDFIAFLISVFLLYDPFKKLSKVHNTIQFGLAGAERIFELLDVRSKIEEPQTPHSFPQNHDISIEDVSFAYEGAEQGALHKVSLQIRAGKKVALVGFSGSGKSTLVDLIPRFIDPTSGCVLIGGVDIRELSLASLRRSIALVGQHTFLFNDTIMNNIAYGLDGATLEQVHAAAKAAYAHDFIMALPQGYDTVIGEAGMSLSGGERQRIAIARAILKDAPILILDEATASLDNRAEREVQSALEVLERGKTSIIIAHRLSTIQNADEIVVMQQGRIVERGTHRELLAAVNSEYAKLHALQFSEKRED